MRHRSCHFQLVEAQAVTWRAITSSPRRNLIRTSILTHNFHRFPSPTLAQFLQPRRIHSLVPLTTRQILSKRPNSSIPLLCSTSLNLNHSYLDPKTSSPVLGLLSQCTTAAMATTKQWTAQEVRDTFLNFFQERGHTFGSCNSLEHFCPPDQYV